MRTHQTDARYCVKDRALGTESAPMARSDAGALATRLTLEAGARGEAVSVGERDRFTVAPAPPPPVEQPSYTALEVEAALCLWEAMLDGRLESTLPADMVETWEATGTHTMRLHARALAPFVLAVHGALPRATVDSHPYDYGIVPAIMAAIRWTPSGYVVPSVAETVAAVVATLEDSAR